MDSRYDRSSRRMYARASADGTRRAKLLLAGVALGVAGLGLYYWFTVRLSNGFDAADTQIDPPPDDLLFPILIGSAVCWLVGIYCVVRAFPPSRVDRPAITR